MADVAGILATGAVGLGGVVVGKAWDLISDSVRWKREQRAAAYANLIVAAEAVYLEMAQTAADFSKADYEGCARELTRASAVVEVVGSEDAVRAMHRIYNDVVLQVDSDELPGITGERWAAQSDDIRSLMDEFRDAARRDMRAKPIKGRTDPGQT